MSQQGTQGARAPETLTVTFPDLSRAIQWRGEVSKAVKAAKLRSPSRLFPLGRISSSDNAQISAGAAEGEG